MSIKILTYGSLRKGEYNYERFRQYFKNGLNHVDTVIIKGFDLYDLGSYPGIKISDDPEKELTVDIMGCSQECYDSIQRMELGAGYSNYPVNINGEDITIYLYHGYTQENRLVKHGDWSKYLKPELV